MIYREPKDKDHPFTMASRKYIFDENLSLQAKGLLTLMLSMKDDWQFYEQELVKYSKNKLASLQTAMKELIAAGYIIRKKQQSTNGKWSGYDYLIYESTEMRFSDNGFSDNGKSTTNDTNLNDNNINDINNGVENNSTRALTFIEYQETKTVSQSVSDCIDYYLRTYEQKQNKQLKLKLDQWDKVTKNLLYIEAIGEDISVDDMKQLIDTHFDYEKYGDCDWNILHFVINGVKNNRFREALY